MGSPEAWDVVKHVASATLKNYLCSRHSAEDIFELQSKNPEDVLANFGISGGFPEARGAPENGALVYALASFCRNPSCRLRAVGIVLKTSQNTVCQRGSAKMDLMSHAFWQFADLPKRHRNRCSRLRARPGWPEPPSAVYAKLRIGAPVYAPRGGLEKRRNVSRSGPGFGGPGASGGSSQDSLNMSL